MDRDKNIEEISKKINELRSQTVFDRIKDINEKENRVHHVFQRNVTNWIFIFESDNFLFEDKPLEEHLLYYYEMQNKGKPLITFERNKTIPYFSLYIEEEMSEVLAYLQIMDNSFMDTNLFLYEQFLSKYQVLYNKIDRLIKFIYERIRFGSFYNYAKGKIKESDLDIYELDRKLDELFDNADSVVLSNWLNLDPSNEYYANEDNLSYCFDFKYYRDPITLTEFPTQKKRYLKTLKSWILKCIDERKKALFLSDEVLPQVYSFITDYAENLLELESKSKSIKKTEQVKFEDNLNLKNIEYPRYIFKDYKSYQFFNHLASHFVSKAQISFLFRMMSEKEKPTLIVVKDTPFREWFNETEHSVKLLYTTDTFEKSKSADRIAMYNIAKELFFNK